MLHDVVERTEVTTSELSRGFGPRVVAIVAGLTQDDSIADYAERKAGLRRPAVQTGDHVLVVFAADKLSKALELRLRWAKRSDSMRSSGIRRRLDHNEYSLHALQEAAPDLVLTRLLAFEVSALRALPPCQSDPSDARS